MQSIPLQAQARAPKINPRELRRGGSVPCCVYGSGIKNLLIQCTEKELHKAFAKAGESTIVALTVEGKNISVLFKDISFDPVSGRELHADFYAVDMKKEIETTVPVRFEGEAPAIKELGAIFVTPHDHVRVRCLPADLPHDLPVSVAKLALFHDVITVADLALPSGVHVMETPDTVLATVQEPRKEEVVAPPPEAAVAEGAPAPASEDEAIPATGAPAAEAAAPAKDKTAKK